MKSKYISPIYILLLILITLLVTSKGINTGFWYNDGATHALTGAYFCDLIKDFPDSLDLYNYTIQYYAKYPALGLIVYPPLFPIVEGVFYLILGVSLLAAKYTIIFFAILGVLFWYLLIKSIYDRHIAFYSGILFITAPGICYWLCEVILEAPALAFIILSVYFFYNFVELDKKRHGYYLALSIAAALWSKQTAIFIVPVFFSYLLLRRKYKKLIERESIISYLFLFFLLLPLILITFKFGGVSVIQSVGTGDIGNHIRLSLENWLYYIKELPDSLGLPIIILTIVSVGIICWRRQLSIELLFLLWIFWAYFIFSYMPFKSSRYIVLYIPPFALLATLAMAKISLRVGKIPISSLLLLILSVFQIVSAYRLPTPFISGYSQAARYVAEELKPAVVLVDGYYDVNFVFHAREYDPQKRMIILRGSKTLFTTSGGQKCLGKREYARNEGDIYTDSGGIQEEAPSLGKPVLVLRKTTERPEGVKAGTVKLVGTEVEDIVKETSILLDSSSEYNAMAKAVNPYGDGKASVRIVKILLDKMLKGARA